MESANINCYCCCHPLDCHGKNSHKSLQGLNKQRESRGRFNLWPIQSSHIWSIQFFCLQLLHIALLKLENTGVFFSLTLLIWVLTCFNVPKHFFFCFLMSISACLFKGLLSKSPVRSDWSARTGMSRCFSSASVFLQPRQVGRDCVVLKSQP